MATWAPVNAGKLGILIAVKGEEGTSILLELLDFFSYESIVELFFFHSILYFFTIFSSYSPSKLILSFFRTFISLSAFSALLCRVECKDAIVTCNKFCSESSIARTFVL